MFFVQLQEAETVQVLSVGVCIAWQYYTSKKATLFAAFVVHAIDLFAIFVPFSMTSDR